MYWNRLLLVALVSILWSTSLLVLPGLHLAMFHTVNKFFPSKTLFDVARNFARIIFMLSGSGSSKNKFCVSALSMSALSEGSTWRVCVILALTYLECDRYESHAYLKIVTSKAWDINDNPSIFNHHPPKKITSLSYWTQLPWQMVDEARHLVFCISSLKLVYKKNYGIKNRHHILNFERNWPTHFWDMVLQLIIKFHESI